MAAYPIQTQRSGPEPSHPACIWEQAGVVRHKHCRHDYHCLSCPYDKALQRVAAENRQARPQERGSGSGKAAIRHWKERLLRLPPPQQPCIHSLKREIEFRPCINRYQCAECEFDHLFEDAYRVHTRISPVEFLDVKGVHLPQGYYLHLGHAWVKTEEQSFVRIGLDDFALRVLGRLEALDTPLMGKTVEQGRVGFTIRRSHRQAAVQAPVSGVVTEINTSLLENPALANEDPYAQGWVMRLHSRSLRHDLKQLLFGPETESFLGREVEELFGVIEEYCGPLAADGGRLGENIADHLPSEAWERLTRTFLHT